MPTNMDHWITRILFQNEGCVVGTEDCLVLRNHSHWLRKGGILSSLAFWWLGDSQTLYKKSGNVCVCLILIYCLETRSPATTGHGHASSVFTDIAGLPHP
jgi:hypothetical protein